MANLLICPHANRFAANPASELKRKKLNKDGNDEKASRKAATEAALAQLEAAMANSAGANSHAVQNGAIQPAQVVGGLPQPLAHSNNATEHFAANENQQHIFQNNITNDRPSNNIGSTMPPAPSPAIGRSYSAGIASVQPLSVFHPSPPELSDDDADNDDGTDSEGSDSDGIDSDEDRKDKEPDVGVGNGQALPIRALPAPFSVGNAS